MDLPQHEAFLRAIFDAPGDDAPRLVYADYLQETGEEELAQFIRLKCECYRYEIEDLRRHNPGGVSTLAEYAALGDVKDDAHVLTLREALTRLVAEHAPHRLRWAGGPCLRGFQGSPDLIRLRDPDLDDLTAFRERVVRSTPEWNGARAVKVESPPAFAPDRVEPLLNLSVFLRVTDWDFSGCRTREVTGYSVIDGSEYTTAVDHVTLTPAGVAALAGAPGAERITALDLRYNNLDDDAGRALVESPYLGNVKFPRLIAGNNFTDDVRQLVIERFGEDAVR